MNTKTLLENHPNLEYLKEYSLLDFLNKRDKHLFSLEETKKIITALGYTTFLLDTEISDFDPQSKTECENYPSYFSISPKTPWKSIHWPVGKGKQCLKRIIKQMESENVPSDFAYIKFYSSADRNACCALVAGKTKLHNPDFSFYTFKDKSSYHCRKNANETHAAQPADLAKIWLYENGCHWYPKKILVFWHPEGTTEHSKSFLAFTAESHIGGLLGLFSS